MKKIFLVSFLLLYLSCEETGSSDEDCAAVLCQADFSSLLLEVLDQESNENVFENGRYEASDILVMDSENQQIAFGIETVSGRELLIFSDEGWESGTFSYTLKIGEENTLNFDMTLDRTGGSGCCSRRLFLDTVTVSGAGYEFEERIEIVTVFL